MSPKEEETPGPPQKMLRCRKRNADGDRDRYFLGHFAGDRWDQDKYNRQRVIMIKSVKCSKSNKVQYHIVLSSRGVHVDGRWKAEPGPVEEWIRQL